MYKELQYLKKSRMVKWYSGIRLAKFQNAARLPAAIQMQLVRTEVAALCQLNFLTDLIPSERRVIR